MEDALRDSQAQLQEKRRGGQTGGRGWVENQWLLSISESVQHSMEVLRPADPLPSPSSSSLCSFSGQTRTTGEEPTGCRGTSGGHGVWAMGAGASRGSTWTPLPWVCPGLDPVSALLCGDQAEELAALRVSTGGCQSPPWKAETLPNVAALELGCVVRGARLLGFGG